LHISFEGHAHILSADSLPGDQILLTITGILLMYLSEIFFSQDIKYGQLGAPSVP